MRINRLDTDPLLHGSTSGSEMTRKPTIEQSMFQSFTRPYHKVHEASSLQSRQAPIPEQLDMLFQPNVAAQLNVATSGFRYIHLQRHDFCSVFCDYFDFLGVYVINITEKSSC